MRSIIVVVACAVVLLAGVARPAAAISAWARRYNVDCSMCHWRVNRLNETGKQFLRQGHRMAGEGSEVDGKAVSISDYWSLTQKIRYVDDENINPAKNTNSKFDVEAFSLYVGGPLDEKYSFFTEQYLHESSTSGADREKLAESYLQYTTLGDDFTTFRAGQIAPFLLHYYETGGRLTVSRPVVFNDGVASVRVGTATGGAPLYNTYRPRARNYGLELAHNWSKGKVYGALGVVNGTGHAPPNIPLDPNNSKDVYLTLEKFLDANGSSVGLYAYRGKAVLSTGTGTAPQEVGGPQENFTRLGVVGNYTARKWALLGAYVMGTDDVLTDVTVTGSTLSGGVAAGEVDSRGYFVEAAYLINPVWSAYGRYDFMDPDKDDTFPGDARVKGPTVGASAWLTKYARVNAELRDLRTGSGPSQRSLVVEAQWMY